MANILPQNKMAQLHYRATGNPESTLPGSAISNCFPGLEYDFKAFWRRVFKGIVLMEWDNYVVDIEDDQYEGLRGHRLLKVNGRPVITTVQGPSIVNGPSGLLPLGKGSPVTMEWSNALAFIFSHHGHTVKCVFTREKSLERESIPDDVSKTMEVDLAIREIFDKDSLAPADGYLRPGELTQGLCSPWQHDYRECSCYYWPASRPDYVNVEPSANGISKGDNWLAKERTGEYVLDDRKDSRLVTYDDLFTKWEEELRFQVKGHDVNQ